MKSLLDSRILDMNGKEAGLEMGKLMDNAGKAVANFVKTLNPRSVVATCGSGNNGGDGYVAALYLLKEGISCDVIPVTGPSSDLCKESYDNFTKSGGRISTVNETKEYDVIIDALLGVGINETPREPYFSFIDGINNSHAKIVSVDIPSGFLTEKAVKPQFTVTMQFEKEGMNSGNCGKIIVADVGFPVSVQEMIGPGDLLALPENEKKSHKGDNGILVVVGGSSEFFGAPIYVAKSALRMGPDLVFLFSPSSIHNHIASNLQDIILRKSGVDFIELNYELMKTIQEKADSIAIGPGISKNPLALEESSKIIEFSLSLNKKVVIDADSLGSVAHITDFRGNAVLTPHRGEFKSTFGAEPTEENAKRIADKINAVILLKGEVDIVTDGKVLKKNTSYHHQSMTRGGTGDLITGAVGALLSKKVDPIHSAFLASYITGKAGLLMFQKKGYGYFTSEIIDFIPVAMEIKN